MPAWLRRSARLVRLGAAAELRSPGLRLFGLVTAVAAAAHAWSQGGAAGSTSVLMTPWLARVFGICACLWFAYAAIRDQNPRFGAALRSKPMDGAFWVLVTWASGLAAWLFLLAAAYLAAMLAQLPASGAASIAAHSLGFARAALIVAFAGTLSFSLSRLLGTPLGGIITMFAWFCAMAGLKYIPAYLQPDYSQNRWLFLASAALLLALTGLVVERFRRGELRRPGGSLALLAALLALAGGGAVSAYRAMPRLYGTPPSIWDMIASQHLEVGQRVPGFWLPDGHGGLVRTAGYEGKLLLIYLFSPADPEAARTLAALDVIRKEFGEQGAQPIAVCLSPDHEDGWALARTGGYGFPIGVDLSTVKTASPPESGVALAYDIELLPALVVTDRRRVARVKLTDLTADLERLRQIVRERLAEEPE